MPHSKKAIREAIAYALDHGWAERPGGVHSHVHCILYCPAASRDGCKIVVNSTPSDPQGIARRIRRAVDRCTH